MTNIQALLAAAESNTPPSLYTRQTALVPRQLAAEVLTFAKAFSGRPDADVVASANNINKEAVSVITQVLQGSFWELWAVSRNARVSAFLNQNHDQPENLPITLMLNKAVMFTPDLNEKDTTEVTDDTVEPEPEARD
jgi:hypothetical protein